MTAQAGSTLALPEEARRALVRELHLALLSEVGARSVCDHLRRSVRDPALDAVLARVNEEGAEVVREVQALLQALGARARRTSLRRRVLARLLASTARLAGPGPVLRIAQDASAKVARWYLQYAWFLAGHGALEQAKTCQRLAATKRLHADSLGAFLHRA
jgi:hypothetical protein